MKPDAEYIAEMTAIQPMPNDIPAEWRGHSGYVAWYNAQLWLYQAYRGEVPHGGIPQPTISASSFNDYTVAERPGRND